MYLHDTEVVELNDVLQYCFAPFLHPVAFMLVELQTNILAFSLGRSGSFQVILNVTFVFTFVGFVVFELSL
ncbi:hypothetical protein J4206_04905 [Candidatus Woesearchaeota archaeon]|nr:hypothetical protein [Candidatus Woesearchaeota archaeon]